MSRLPVYFLSHGGGPWPWMPEQLHGPYAGLAAALRGLEADAGARPKAILMVSAHWEAPRFLAQAAARPSMIYDYAGFPEHTYRIRYPAPGDPALASRAATLLAAAGLPAGEDPERGFDHGAYTPLAVAWPQADVPVVQLSLLKGLDPETHLRAGRALATLRDEGVLLIGSGLSYHNLRAFGAAGFSASKAFDAWLSKVLDAEPGERTGALLAWERAPCAREAHPHEEHLLPLMVALGAAEEEPAARIYHEDAFMGGLAVSSWRIGAPARV